jgi:hypothetical protein
VYRRLGGNKGALLSRGLYIYFFYGKGNENHQLGTGKSYTPLLKVN